MAESGADLVDPGQASTLGRDGFLLVEVLVAMVLLAVGLSAALALLLQAVAAMDRAALMGQAAPRVAGDALSRPGLTRGRLEEDPLHLEWEWVEEGLHLRQVFPRGGPEGGGWVPVPWYRAEDWMPPGGGIGGTDGEGSPP